MRDDANFLRSPKTPDPPSLFTAEAARFREVLAAGRSTVFLQLFDFLVARSGDERAPKEIEIALAIFGKDGESDTLQDSAVRVYVHRLRKRLEEFYSGKQGPRLQIAKGQYRIILENPAVASTSQWAWFEDLRRRRLVALLGAFALVSALNSAVWMYLAPRHPSALPEQEPNVGTFWSAGTVPRLIVVGDSYLLAETDNQKDIKRLVLDPTIQSRDALGGYLTTHPLDFFKLYDLDLRYAPAGTAIAAWNVIPAVLSAQPAGTAPPHLVSSSRLTPQQLESTDIVYVGQMSNLGILAAALSRASGFRLDQSRALIDQSSGKRYAADAGAGFNQQSRLDYGYIARFPGPSGHHVILIAGLGDLGVQSMATLVNDPTELNRLADRSRARQSFEALYEIRAMGTAILDKSLVTARPLRSVHMWDIRTVPR